MVLPSPLKINQRFYIKYQSYFRGADSNRGSNLYTDIQNLWVLAEIKELSKSPQHIEFFIPELKQVLQVNKKYFQMQYVQLVLPEQGRCLVGMSFSLQSQNKLKQISCFFSVKWKKKENKI
jgi:hypothetical protein